MTDLNPSKRPEAIRKRLDWADSTDEPLPHRWMMALLDDLRFLLEEIERLQAWHDDAVPIIAALAIYGEGANIAALVAKAGALNEVEPWR